MIDRRRFLALSGALVLGAPARADAPLEVVASMSIIGDFVKQIGGDHVQVSLLVGPGGDVHVYQPSPADARRVAQAKLVFINGLGLEGWLPRLVQSSGGKASVAILSKGVQAIRDDADGHGHNLDPHAWQDVRNARTYALNVRDALATADPARAAAYASRTENYIAELNALDSEIRAGIAQVPTERRRIITTHDAFGYYAKAYGLAFIAPQGVSTDAEASSRDVARIIRQIRAEKIPAVFLENISDPRLVTQIARETGAKIGGAVFSDSLSGPDGPATTYVQMMRANLRAFTDALR